jgi:hypothetical protein
MQLEEMVFQLKPGCKELFDLPVHEIINLIDCGDFHPYGLNIDFEFRVGLSVSGFQILKDPYFYVAREVMGKYLKYHFRGGHDYLTLIGYLVNTIFVPLTHRHSSSLIFVSNPRFISCKISADNIEDLRKFTQASQLMLHHLTSRNLDVMGIMGSYFS